MMFLSVLTSLRRTGLSFEEQGGARTSVLLLLIGIVLVLIIIVLAVLFLVRQKRTSGRPTGIRMVGLLFGLVSLGLMIVATQGYRKVEKPSFCLDCHRGKAAISIGMSHNNMNCLSCHARPGRLGRFAWRIDYAMKLTTLKLTGKLPAGRDNPGVDSKGCLSRCHSRLKSEISGRGRIRMRHAEVVRAGYQCLDCHPQINHGFMPESSRLTRMARCAGCHNGAKAPGDCGLCHTGRTNVTATPTLTKYRKVQLTEALKCGSCHDTEACNRCHDLGLLPHSAGWKQGRHQKEGSERRADCLKCHKEQDCRKCHDPSPHTDGNWLQEHRQVGQIERPACDGCHEDRFCRQCHDEIGL